MSKLPVPTEGKAQTHAMQQAIALAYGESDYAPKVVAKGRGLIAEQIIAKAKENNVYVHESKELLSLLMQVDLDDHIPPALYQAIAEILAWLYNLEQAQSQAKLAEKSSNVGVLHPF